MSVGSKQGSGSRSSDEDGKTSVRVGTFAILSLYARHAGEYILTCQQLYEYALL